MKTTNSVENILEPHVDPYAEEAAFRMETGNILFIQTCEDGYDYSLFTSDYLLLDGGQLDDPAVSLSQAGVEILLDLDPQGPVIEALDAEELETLLETAI